MKKRDIAINVTNLGVPTGTLLRGTRLEGTLLSDPVLRIKPKSDYLLKLERSQEIVYPVDRIQWGHLKSVK